MNAWNNKRGSILLIAVVFAALIALSVGTFLQLANGENRLSNLAFHSNGSLNLAEAGIEKSLFAINHNEWTGWQRSGSTAVMNPESIDLGSGITGVINARIDDLSTNPIVVVAQGTMQVAGRPDVTKQVEVRLVRRGLFGTNGITTRRGVRFSGGNAEVNSYRSQWGRPGVWVPAIGGLNINDNGSVASTLVTTNAINLSNSTIFGRVATGGSWPTVGPNGRIHGKDTPAGVRVDPSRVALDFNSDFPMITPPTSYDRVITSINNAMVLGTVGAAKPEVIRVGSISLSGNTSQILQIVGPVEIHLTGSASVSGNASIVVASTGSATFFVDGNLSIGGNGTFNATNKPANLLIFGTNAVSQTFTLHGNGQWQAAVYAPNANVSLQGGGTSGMMAGAIVANRVDINGNYSFHFDEDLAELLHDDLSFRMENWRELHLAADRVTF